VIKADAKVCLHAQIDMAQLDGRDFSEIGV